MHHRGQSAEHDRPAVTHTCPLIYVAQCSQKKSAAPPRPHVRVVPVLKLNFIVTLSCCYCTSSKSHFLHQTFWDCVLASHSRDGGGRRDGYIWTKPCYLRRHARTSALPDSQVLNQFGRFRLDCCHSGLYL